MDVGKRRACLTRIYMYCSATTWILTVIYSSTQHEHLSSTKYDTCVIKQSKYDIDNVSFQ